MCVSVSACECVCLSVSVVVFASLRLSVSVFAFVCIGIEHTVRYSSSSTSGLKAGFENDRIIAGGRDCRGMQRGTMCVRV